MIDEDRIVLEQKKQAAAFGSIQRAPVATKVCRLCEVPVPIHQWVEHFHDHAVLAQSGGLSQLGNIP